MACLNTQLDDLKKQNGQHYNPARFGFIESLVARANQQRDSVRTQLNTKAQQAINTYQTELTTAKTQAQALLDELKNHSSNSPEPTQLTRAQQYYQQGQYYKVMQLAQLKCTPSHTNTIKKLTLLTQLLEKNHSVEHIVDNSFTLNELLQEQERSLLKNSYLKTEKKKTSNNPTLRSGKVFQQRRIKQRADDFISSALEKTPKNPGPLNPEMLAIRLLKSMRELSPAYLNRCSSYFETLLWLEQSTTKPSNAKARNK